MSKESETEVKYCVYCGATIEKGKTYCPNCGKLILKIDSEKAQIKPKEQVRTSIKSKKISRKCPGCGSIITSNILEQCPICNATLEKIPEEERLAAQKRPGLIFTNKKFELEQKLILKKDTWNLREGINVFSTSLYILILIFFLIYMLLTFQSDISSIIKIVTLQIPEALFAVYPIWYIYSKNHSYKKLGLIPGSKKFLYGLIIGILGGSFIFLINFLFGFIINFIGELGLDFFDLIAGMKEQNLTIQNADLMWIILLTALLILASISIEIVFRGVLHNAIKQRIKNEIYVILLVALIYSVIMVILTFPLGIYYFFMNFLIFTVLGILYEINGNLYNSILGHIFYNLLLISFIIFIG